MITRTQPRRAVIYTALAVAVAVVLFVVLERTQSAPVPQVSVIEATRDIQIDEPITVSMVQVVAVPQAALIGPTPTLGSDLGVVLRSRATVPIQAGMPIQRAWLFGPGLVSAPNEPDAGFLKRGDALYTVPTGHLRMPLSGLRAGDYVEVLAALTPDTMLTTGTTLTAGATDALTTTAQPVDPHALVSFVQPDQGAITLGVAKGELPYLAWLTAHGATFSFALVRPDDTQSDMRGVTARQFEEHYHVPRP